MSAGTEEDTDKKPDEMGLTAESKEIAIKEDKDTSEDEIEKTELEK